MTWNGGRRLVAIDHEDMAQERLLAELEGRDPDAAVKAIVNEEKRYRDIVSAEFNLEHEDRFAQAPMALPTSRRNRSEESKEQRREYTRQWWRKNGREYRAKRARERQIARLTPTTSEHALAGRPAA